MGPAKVTIFGLYNQKGWIQKVHTDFEYFDVLYFVGTSKLLYVVVVVVVVVVFCFDGQTCRVGVSQFQVCFVSEICGGKWHRRRRFAEGMVWPDAGDHRETQRP